MQILPQGLDSQINAVLPDRRSGLEDATTSNRSDGSFKDLLRANEKAGAKEVNQSRPQGKKGAPSQPDEKTSYENRPYEKTPPKKINEAQADQVASAQKAGDLPDKTGKIENDKSDNAGNADTTGILFTLIAIGQQGIKAQDTQPTDQIQGASLEPGVTAAASTKNGTESAATNLPIDQGNMPGGLSGALITQQDAMRQAAQTPVKDPAAAEISKDVKGMTNEPSSAPLMKAETFNINPNALMSDKISHGAAPVQGKNKIQFSQSSQDAMASINKNTAAQTTGNNQVDAKATGITNNSGPKEAINTASWPTGAPDKTGNQGMAAGTSPVMADVAGADKQPAGQASLQTTQTNSAQNTADIAAQVTQGPKNQQASKGPQNAKDAVATPQSMTGDNKNVNGVKIGYANSQQDSAGAGAGSDNDGKTARVPENPKVTKTEDQTPGQFVLGVANNATDKASNDTKLPRTDLIDKKDLAQGIKDQVFSNLSIGDKRVVLHLDPPDLGKVRVDITLTSNNELKATFAADHPDVRNIIQGQMDGLKSHLDQKGFNVTQLKVDGGVQTGFTSLDHRGQGNPGNWANDVITQPVSKNNMGQDINDTTDGLMQNAFMPQNRTQNGRVNLVI